MSQGEESQGQVNMEAVEEAEEEELLGGEGVEGDGDVEGDVDETAEDLMTDMKLEDETDEIRAKEPNFDWTYHIEIYPWNVDDMTEAFVRLMKLAHFTQVYMRRKGSGKESDASSEKVEDKLLGRQRKGCVHLYTDSWLNARSILRSATWKSMVSKELTFEITRRDPAGHTESAYLEVETYSASKTRFREKPKGELKDRSAKVSNLPGTISWEFLEVVFCRTFPVIGGSPLKEYLKDKESNPPQKLQDVKEFDGSMDFDCLARGSCRAFVLAHKSVFIDGQKISVEANNKETMIVPPFSHEPGVTKKEADVSTATPQSNASQPGHGKGAKTVRGRGTSNNNRGTSSTARGRGGLMRETGSGRGRGLGRGTTPAQRPASAPFGRAGPGMPVPMTGRQKMNEKMRRSNFGMSVAGGSGLFALLGGNLNARAAGVGSVGDSFKQELASLQTQLERSTQELEARIAMLQQTTHSRGRAFYQPDMANFHTGGWDDRNFDYNEGYLDDDFYLDDGAYGGMSHRRPAPSVMSHNMGFPKGPRAHVGPAHPPEQSFRRGDLRAPRRGGSLSREAQSEYW